MRSGTTESEGRMSIFSPKEARVRLYQRRAFCLSFLRCQHWLIGSHFAAADSPVWPVMMNKFKQSSTGSCADRRNEYHEV